MERAEPIVETYSAKCKKWMIRVIIFILKSLAVWYIGRVAPLPTAQGGWKARVLSIASLVGNIHIYLNLALSLVKVETPHHFECYLFRVGWAK